MIKGIVASSLLASLLALSSQALSQKGSADSWDDILYGELKSVKYFGTINVFVEGTNWSNPDAKNEIGLSGGELAQHLKLRFKNNFANFPYRTDYKLSEMSKAERAQVGMLLCVVWTVGKSYPVAYHVECTISTHGRDLPIEKSAVLGITTDREAERKIHEAIDDMVTKFAQLFFRVRGEL